MLPYRRRVTKVLTNTTLDTIDVLVVDFASWFVLTHISAYDSDNAVSAIGFRVGPFDSGIEFDHQNTIAANVRAEFNNAPLLLCNGDHIFVDFYGITGGDLCVVNFHGYWIEDIQEIKNLNIMSELFARVFP